MEETSTAWFTSLTGFGNDKLADVGVLSFVAIMLISLACSLFISFLYTRFYGSRATGSMVHRSFPLLGLSVTGIFICIQFSLPLSLGLLGALSIVRFRTPIKEPEEIGFIMLVIATSICCATFNLFFLGIIVAVAVVALIISSVARGLFKGALNDGLLVVTLPIDEYRSTNQQLIGTLERKLPKGRLESISEANGESIVSYGFVRLGTQDLLDLQKKLSDVAANARTNVFFNRAGEV